MCALSGVHGLLMMRLTGTIAIVLIVMGWARACWGEISTTSVSVEWCHGFDGGSDTPWDARLSKRIKISVTRGVFSDFLRLVC